MGKARDLRDISDYISRALAHYDIPKPLGVRQLGAKPLCCLAIGKSAAWRGAYTNAVPFVSFVPFVSSKALQALFLFFAAAKIKKAGDVLLSHGRVPHYPRRWGP